MISNMSKIQKSIFNQKYRDFIASIVKQRQSIHMTQRQLGDKLGVGQCYIARVETHERRLDLLESIQMMRALEMSDEQIIDEIKKLMQ